MKIPDSLKAELAAFNDGKGIDLESWIRWEGNFFGPLATPLSSGPSSLSSTDTYCVRDFQKTRSEDSNDSKLVIASPSNVS